MTGGAGFIGSHLVDALVERGRAFSTSQASSTEHGHRHARRRAQRIGADSSGGDEK